MSNFAKTQQVLAEGKRGSGLFGDFLPKDIKSEKDLRDAMKHFSKRPYAAIQLFAKQMKARPGSQAGYKSIDKFTTTDNSTFKDVTITLMKKSDTEYMLMMVGSGISRQLAFTI